jgi:hypothetical protein
MKGIHLPARIQRLALLAICLTSMHLNAQTMSPWLTRSGDNARSGWNSHETTLTQANLTSVGIVRSTIIPLVGDRPEHGSTNTDCAERNDGGVLFIQ